LNEDEEKFYRSTETPVLFEDELQFLLEESIHIIALTSNASQRPKELLRSVVPLFTFIKYFITLENTLSCYC
jgi:hypothetical protein